MSDGNEGWISTEKCITCDAERVEGKKERGKYEQERY
jgi:hypothetical protein